MKNAWNFASRTNPGKGDRANQPLELGWFLDWDSISDEYTPNEISAKDLFSMWLERIGDVETMRIRWWIPRLRESAPFTDEEEDFLTFYSWPVNAETGERLNWLTLPIADKGWNGHHAEKGGFIQEVTGWKPSALQRSVHIPTLLKACGLRK
jgi:hypothetical protein